MCSILLTKWGNSNCAWYAIPADVKKQAVYQLREKLSIEESLKPDSLDNLIDQAFLNRLCAARKLWQRRTWQTQWDERKRRDERDVWLLRAMTNDQQQQTAGTSNVVHPQTGRKQSKCDDRMRISAILQPEEH